MVIASSTKWRRMEEPPEGSVACGGWDTSLEWAETPSISNSVFTGGGSANSHPLISPRAASYSLYSAPMKSVALHRQLCLALILVASSSPVHAQRAPRAAVSCGVERWRVKILADQDRERVNWSPQTTSIRALRRLPVPQQGYPATRRIPPYELALYRVRAVVRQILSESDGDWHVVLADPDDAQQTMVAKIPDSSCALGSGHEADYAQARRSLRYL